MLRILLWTLLLSGSSLSLVYADEVTACPTTTGSITVIRTSHRPGLPDETEAQTATRRVQETLAARPDINAADCQTLDETNLPDQAKRYAWRMRGKQVVVDDTVPEPETPTEIPVGALPGALGGALAALGIASLSGRKKPTL